MIEYERVLNIETNRFIYVHGKSYKSLKYVTYNISYDILLQYINILYKIGNLGRVLLYDTSEMFVRSKRTLAQFCTTLAKTPQSVENTFMNLKSYSNKKLKHIVRSILLEQQTHVVNHGFDVISIFVRYFTLLEQRFSITYDATLTKAFFEKKYGAIRIMDFIHFNNPFVESQPAQIRANYFLKHCNSSLFNCKTNVDLIYNYVNENSVVEPCMATLDVNNDWNEIPLWRIVCLETHYFFDLFFLLKVFYFQLNASDFNNPLPLYPCNPFTKEKVSKRKLYSIHFLWKMIHSSSQQKNSALHMFLSNDFLWNIHNDREWREIFIVKLQETLRWKRIQNTDSQNNFQGLWVSKHNAKTGIENLISAWLDTNNNSIRNKIMTIKPHIISDNSIWNVHC